MRKAGDGNGGGRAAGRHTVLCLALSLLTVAVFGQVRGHGFSQLDDNAYVTGNLVVRSGLNRSGLSWAFTSLFASNWHPLTWLSHMLDVELFGLSPGPHHLVNLLFHLANVLILYGLLAAITGARERSAFVAALFAIHPLHVESVAWIAERKDLLSTFFGFLCIGAYARYAKRPTAGRYLPVPLLLGLSLLSKPMLVTLPFVLLLLDFWPLERWSRERAGGLLLEKVPLLLLSAASSAATLVAQVSGGAVAPLDHLALPARLGNAAISYVRYIGKTVWPRGLSFFYPYAREELTWWNVAGAVVMLSALTCASIRVGRTRRYVPAGWFFFLGTLVPVIGIVQAGTQAMADRYAYVPCLGLFLIVAWGLPDLAVRFRLRQRVARPALAAAAIAAIAALSIVSFRQAGYWASDEALFRRALSVTRGNWMAHYLLGSSLGAGGDIEGGLEQLRAAVAVRPDHAPSHGNTAVFLSMRGRYREAVPHHEASVALQPGSPAHRYNYGVTLLRLGLPDAAAAQFREALALDAGFPGAGDMLEEALRARSNPGVGRSGKEMASPAGFEPASPP